MSEMKKGIYTLAFDTPCMSPTLYDIVLLYLVKAVIFVATASHLEREFGWFPSAKMV
jgi:hypothetical protein